MLVLQLAEHVFVGQSTIGISLFKLETPYADPHVRCCERCDAKTSAYSIAALQPGVCFRIYFLIACLSDIPDFFLLKLDLPVAKYESMNYYSYIR